MEFFIRFMIALCEVRVYDGFKVQMEGFPNQRPIRGLEKINLMKPATNKALEG